MSQENENGIPEEVKTFSVPDESKRIEDPALAESMARRSNVFRSQEAKLLRSAKDHKARGDTDLAKKRALSAITADWTADYQEEWAGIEHKVSQMDTTMLTSRKDQLLQEEVEAKKTYKAVANQISTEAIDAHHRLEQIHVELSAIEKRLTE